MDKTKIYVAGSWKNRLLIRDLMEEMESWGHIVLVDWTNHEEKGCAKQYAEQDIKGLKECDCLVYCMDGQKSRGKNFELGYVAALNKPTVVYLSTIDFSTIGKDIEDVSYDGIIDYMTTNECVFIRALMFPVLHTAEELKTWLSNFKKDDDEEQC